MAEPTPNPPPQPEPKAPAPSEEAERLDAELDEGLEETFPASDPPAVTRREDH